ncbi:protein of unknown function [Polaromonas sp. OV174]|uniref:DUF4389 domain-containing protein n=1 Tax=Polaromonas sp. OV174 TaxID=1855300 RepID=UPI0008F01B7A|nr:DUF4389 domain-containing protein [Polaromonas sp. OV174]SFB94716.1 protein of unknown function [Polaromonas sp. OV174]
MNELIAPVPPRKLWLRLVLMLLMALAFQLAVWLLSLVALLQLLLAVVTDAPNARLQQLGKSLGRYLAQIAVFESFGSEELPFPFSEWPADTSQTKL